MLANESFNELFSAENFLIDQEKDFNDETKTALNEAKLISEGKIPSKSFNNVNDLIKDLMSDVDD